LPKSRGSLCGRIIKRRMSSSMSLIKMDDEDTPYGNPIRLNKTIQFLPVTDIKNDR
jgi:hypothetical protein